MQLNIDFNSIVTIRRNKHYKAYDYLSLLRASNCYLYDLVLPNLRTCLCCNTFDNFKQITSCWFVLDPILVTRFRRSNSQDLMVWPLLDYLQTFLPFIALNNPPNPSWEVKVHLEGGRVTIKKACQIKQWWIWKWEWRPFKLWLIWKVKWA